MPNANVIARLMGADSPAQGKTAIPSFTQGTPTTAQIVTDQTAGGAFLIASTAAAGASQFSATKAGGINFDGMPFRIRVVGRVTTTGSTNITVAIMQASSATTTYTSGNVIATTQARAVNTASANFLLEATCMWDSTSTKLNGIQHDWNGTTPTIDAEAVLTNQLAITTQSSLGFEIAVTSSTASTATFYFSEFVIETL